MMLFRVGCTYLQLQMDELRAVRVESTSVVVYYKTGEFHSFAGNGFQVGKIKEWLEGELAKQVAVPAPLEIALNAYEQRVMDLDVPTVLTIDSPAKKLEVV